VTEREQIALTTIKKYMWWSVGAGLVPLPVVDWLAVSGVQIKMLADISKVYDVPFQANQGKAAIATLGGFALPHALAYGWFGSLLKTIPVVGMLSGAPSMAMFCAAYAWALGKVFIMHFESGGTFLNFNPEEVKDYFKTEFQEGRTIALTMAADGSFGTPVTQ
jgi:uncharacterized protein (DUF697 family)